jgi:mRNA (guanine-N7-)-methyltransferase
MEQKKQSNNIFKDIDEEENLSSEEDSELDDEQKDIFFNSSKSKSKSNIDLNTITNENHKENNLGLNEENSNKENSNSNKKIQIKNFHHNQNEIEKQKTNEIKEDDLFGDVYNPNEQNEKKKNNKNLISYDQYYKQNILDPGNEGRKASRVLFLRTFNNWVKATMINKYTFLLGRNRENLSILDLCCGRGGDLEKFFRSKVQIYVGSDLAQESLKNAMDRFEKLKNEKFKDLKCKCYFICEDLSSSKNNLMVRIPNEIYFDFVSCQFALHYHFETEVRLRTFLKNVVERLNHGGYFIGTIIDSNVMVKRLRESKSDNKNIYRNDKFTFGNEYYAVKFSQKRFPKDKPFGIKYGFYLEDSIDKRDASGQINFVEEYLIIFEKLVEICEEFDLYLVDSKNLHEFYDENAQNKFYKNMLDKMLKDSNNPNVMDQWDIIYLYKMFVFRKGKKNYGQYEPVIRKNKIVVKDWNPVLITDEFD